MYKRVAFLAGALTLVLSTAAFAADVTGRVVRVDPGTNLIVLDNGQAFRVAPNTVVLVDNQPVTLGTIQPGQAVVIRSGEAVMVAPSASPPTVSAPAGSTVIVQSPAAGAPAIARQTIYGSVVDVDPGEIKVKTDGGDFEVKVPRDVTSQLKKGDNVRLDLTFMPAR